MVSLLSTLLADDPLAARGQPMDVSSDELDPPSLSSTPPAMSTQFVRGRRPLEEAQRVARRNSRETSTVDFKILYNDNTEDNMLRLIEAKNVFAKQLPKMPKDYIVRLVFDRRHRTFVMLKEGELIAGCCFRPFLDRKFAEIVFLAVTAAEQVRGFGSQLMNHLKEYCKTIGICYFLTYADNFATGYFKKQGFTEQISMPKDQWHGFIKDYDGGTLMGCPIFDSIDYLDIAASVKHVRENILLKAVLGDAAVRSLTWEKVTYSPLDASTSSRFRPRVTLHEQLHKFLERASKMTNSWPFREPVAGVPGYSDVIQQPIDLKTMMDKNQRNLYRSRADLQGDLDLMVKNAITFNGENHEISKLGRELLELLLPKLQAIVEYHDDSSLIKL